MTLHPRNIECSISYVQWLCGDHVLIDHLATTVYSRFLALLHFLDFKPHRMLECTRGWPTAAMQVRTILSLRTHLQYQIILAGLSTSMDSMAAQVDTLSQPHNVLNSS